MEYSFCPVGFLASTVAGFYFAIHMGSIIVIQLILFEVKVLSEGAANPLTGNWSREPVVFRTTGDYAPQDE